MVTNIEDYTTPETQDQNSKENYSHILNYELLLGPPPSIVEVMTEWSHTSHSAICVHDVHKDSFLFTFRDQGFFFSVSQRCDFSDPAITLERPVSP